MDWRGPSRWEQEVVIAVMGWRDGQRLTQGHGSGDSSYPLAELERNSVLIYHLLGTNKQPDPDNTIIILKYQFFS